MGLRGPKHQVNGIGVRRTAEVSRVLESEGVELKQSIRRAPVYSEIMIRNNVIWYWHVVNYLSNISATDIHSNESFTLIVMKVLP